MTVQQPPTLPTGSYIEGTLQPRDIVPTVIALLQAYAPLGSETLIQLNDDVLHGYPSHFDVWSSLADAYDILSEHCSPGRYQTQQGCEICREYGLTNNQPKDTDQ